MRILVLGAVLVLACGSVLAHKPSATECQEAGDFIRNAALARDGGTTREFFVDRLHEDYVLIRAFRPELRWFVRDADDEEFLQAEVERVFDAPLAGERHRTDFLERCTQRSSDL